jgi:hypothetical protein
MIWRITVLCKFYKILYSSVVRDRLKMYVFSIDDLLSLRPSDTEHPRQPP